MPVIFKRSNVLKQTAVTYITDDGQQFSEEREAATWQLARDLSLATGTGPQECTDIINLLEEQNLLADEWWVL